jgi:topoisomerase-4 subunit A
LDYPESNLELLFKFIQGPDFPTAADIITPKQQIKTMYEQGTGSIKCRALYVVEKQQIIITALPYQVSGAKVLEQIANQMQQKKLPVLEDLRDESDHESPTRLVLKLRSTRVEADTLMRHLFATTDLERSYRYNANLIGLNGKPEVKSLLQILNEWLNYRIETVRRRLNHRLAQVLDRLEVISGLLMIYLHLDEVIRIIREEDEPAQVLMQTFKLSERQVYAILETKLRHLAKLEETLLQAEHAELQKEQEYLQNCLTSDKKLRGLIKSEIQEDLKKHTDARRSNIIERQAAQAMSVEDSIPNEWLTIIMSKQGWIRAAKGNEIKGESFPFKAGDSFLTQTTARSTQGVNFFDSEGKIYQLAAHSLPSARGQGEPLSSRLNPADGVHFISLGCTEQDGFYLMTNSAGLGFCLPESACQTKNRAGKLCMQLPENSTLLAPISVSAVEDKYLALLNSAGRLLIISLKEVPVLGKGKGNILIKCKSTLEHEPIHLLSAIILTNEQKLLITTAKNVQKWDFNKWKLFIGKRGQTGKTLPKNMASAYLLEIEKS